MHPDKRRAGRAIRKKRRLARERFASHPADVIAEFAAAVSITVKVIVDGFVTALENVGQALIDMSAQMREVDYPQRALWDSENPESGVEFPK